MRNGRHCGDVHRILDLRSALRTEQNGREQPGRAERLFCAVRQNVNFSGEPTQMARVGRVASGVQSTTVVMHSTTVVLL